MKIEEQIQRGIHMLEVGFGSRVVSMLAIVLAVVGLGMLYDIRAYHNLDSPDAMDAAQVARNLADGRGFTTKNIRIFSVYLVQKHNRELHPAEVLSTNAPDFAELDKPHPDLANAPVYPVALAGLMKLWPPRWQVDLKHPFWSEGGMFRRYQPDFRIAIFNQLLLLLVIVLTYLVAQKIYGSQTAWLAALLTVGLDTLWRFSVSGQSTLLLMVIFLSLAWCLVKLEENGRAEVSAAGINFWLAPAIGVLAGLGMLTRYSFGWLIVPVLIFVVQFGGSRRKGLAVMTALVFVVVVSPWIVRNFGVSGTPFGTAGYAVAENTAAFPGAILMQSMHPDLADYSYFWAHYTGKKFVDGLAAISKGDLLQLGGGWLGMLFFTGLLMILPRENTRRLRYFVLMCLGVFLVIEPLGRTQLSTISPETSSENLLVLLTPFVAIFGTGFFLALLNRMELPDLLARGIALLALFAAVWQPLATSLVTGRTTVAYPPYYPPDIQKIAGWMQPDELMMSDIPWAVAWYGDRQCACTTINSQYEFFLFNDHAKTVSALYLSLNTIDSRIFSECIQGGIGNWNRFCCQLLANDSMASGDDPLKIALAKSMEAKLTQAIVAAKAKPEDAENIGLHPSIEDIHITDFPLIYSPQETLGSGFFLTDRQRW